MRSNSVSFADEVLHARGHADALDCRAMNATARRGAQVRVFGVALEVAAPDRVPLQVDRRREQHVHPAVARFGSERGADPFDERRIPRRAERGAAREQRRRPPGPALAAHSARPVGHLERGDAEPSASRQVPQIDAREQQALLVERELGSRAPRSGRSSRHPLGSITLPTITACCYQCRTVRRHHSSKLPADPGAAVIRTERRGAVAIVTIDNPPVNALPVAGWFELADAHPRRRAAIRPTHVRDPGGRGQGLPGRRRHQGAGRRPHASRASSASTAAARRRSPRCTTARCR